MESILLALVFTGLCAVVYSQGMPPIDLPPPPPPPPHVLQCRKEAARCSNKARLLFDQAGGNVNGQCDALLFGLNCLGMASGNCPDWTLEQAIIDTRGQMNNLRCKGPVLVDGPQQQQHQQQLQQQQQEHQQQHEQQQKQQEQHQQQQYERRVDGWGRPLGGGGGGGGYSSVSSVKASLVVISTITLLMAIVA